MKSHPTPKVLRFLCLVLLTFALNYSCSKDEGLLHDAVLSTPTESVEEKPETVEKDTVAAPETAVEEEPEFVEEDLTAKVFETRTTVFSPINDAHVQGENGYDQSIVRLEHNHRVSYLMFDLSLIDSIGGSVTASNLEFTIAKDDGDGTISIFKGASNEWSEEELSKTTAPEPDSLLGQLSAKYDVGRTLEVALDTSLVRPEMLTLVMTHQEGNDLAFASKENTTRNGPALVVTYSVPQDAEAIVFDEQENAIRPTIAAEASDSDPAAVEANNTEEITDPETVQAPSDTGEVENNGEETTEAETAEVATTEDTTEESAVEANTEEATTEEETKIGESAVETNAEEATTEAETSTEESEEMASTEEATTKAETKTGESEEMASTEEETTEAETKPEESAEAASTEEETTEAETKPEESAEAASTKEAIAEAETNNEADAPQNQAPIAVAEASTISGNAPLEVRFKGGSSTDDQGIEQYVWDFRDGATSYEANPVHTFEKSGTLEVRLTVTDAQGESHTDTISITIKEEEKENQPPVATPKVSPASGDAPLEVQFNGTDSSDDKAITGYSWDFKEGSEADSANPSHTFSEAGTYDVVLTVRDEDGLESSRIVTVTVNEAENKEPVALPKASTASGEAPLEVQFTGDESTDDNAITKYSWDFKDGSFANTANPSHTFNEPGAYNVVLNVEDEEGLSNARIVTVTVTGVENEAPKAIASGTSLTGDAPLDVQFKGTDSKDDEGVTGYFWDFKDGSTTTNSNPSHTFSEPGEYDVTLDVKDKQGLTHSTTLKVTVNQAPSNNGGDSGSGSGNSGSTGGGNTGGGDTGSGGSGNNGGSSDNGSNESPSKGVKASTFGYNSSDATNALKAAINSSHSTIIVDKQAGDWVVGSLYLNGIRNKTIIFEQGVVLRAKRGAFRPQDRLFQLVNSENVEIQGYGATFAMNKSEYSGQQNHALAIVNSSNITVKGLTLTGAGGDGIYISRHNDGEYCRNILIDGVVSTQNQRQGITVISVDGLQIKNSTFSETSGESPSAGIDFEPESTRDRLNNIVVSNCTFKNNNGPGIMFAVNKASSSTRPIDATFRNIVVSNNSINNPRLYPSEIDLGMSSDYRTNPVKGTITFDGLRVENSRWSAIYTKKTLESYHVNVKNAVFKNVSKSGKEAAIHIGLLSYGNRSNANMGGFTFENVLIDYDGQAPSLELFGPGHGNWDLGNLRGEIRVRSPRGARLNDNMNKLSNSSSSVNLRVVEN